MQPLFNKFTLRVKWTSENGSFCPKSPGGHLCYSKMKIRGNAHSPADGDDSTRPQWYLFFASAAFFLAELADLGVSGSWQLFLNPK